jgi:hypothetical protein
MVIGEWLPLGTTFWLRLGQAGQSDESHEKLREEACWRVAGLFPFRQPFGFVVRHASSCVRGPAEITSVSSSRRSSSPTSGVRALWWKV